MRWSVTKTFIHMSIHAHKRQTGIEFRITKQVNIEKKILVMEILLGQGWKILTRIFLGRERKENEYCAVRGAKCNIPIQSSHCGTDRKQAGNRQGIDKDHT